MSSAPAEYLTTRELADLLRIGERKVYDLSASGEIPCLRVGGKLLFPRADVLAWLEQARSGPRPGAGAAPAIMAGSHDPLLDWALHESGSGLAGFFDGSMDGLERLGRLEAAAAGMHVHEPDGWNVAAVRAALGDRPVVLVEFARRERGIVVAPQHADRVRRIADLAGLRLARRQATAASQTLFDDLARKAGIDPNEAPAPAVSARTEDELVRHVADGRADAAFGLRSIAAQAGLPFVPVLTERFDLLAWRHAWFEPPLQRFLSFTRGPAFARRAAGLAGHDVSGLGTVHFNGPPP